MKLNLICEPAGAELLIDIDIASWA